MATNNNDKTLNVPHLRFPEFSGEWEEHQLRNVCKLLSGGTPALDISCYWNGNIPFISATAMHKPYIIDSEQYLSEEGLVHGSKLLKQGNLLLLVRGSMLWKRIPVCYNRVDVAFNQDVKGIIPNNVTNSLFLLYWFLSQENRIKYMVTGTGIGAGKLDMEDLLSMKILLPLQDEQRKVVSLLQLIDARIATQNKIIEKYESLIQAVIYQKKTDGIRMGDWQKTELSKVLQERNEKNINGYDVCSVSVSQGVVNQIEYLGRSFAAKETSHYNVVKYGDIVYTKSPTGDFPYGIVKRSCIKDGVAVSPLYGVYMPANDHIGVILHFYFMQPNNASNYLHPLIQKGAKNTINITNRRFLENSIPLPKTENEALCIANALKTIQKKIDTEKGLLQSYEKEKEYLLCQMFI